MLALSTGKAGALPWGAPPAPILWLHRGFDQEPIVADGTAPSCLVSLDGGMASAEVLPVWLPPSGGPSTSRRLIMTVATTTLRAWF